MKESYRRKTVIILPVLLCAIGMIAMSAFLIYNSRSLVFRHISALCEIMVKENPEAEVLMLSSLKKYQTFTEQAVRGNGFLERYGYGAAGFGWNIPYNYIIFSVAVFLCTVCGFIFAMWYVDVRNRRRIAELTGYLERINVGGEVSILQTREDGFAHLQDEMYKTVTSLYQSREKAMEAKTAYADNLANIAHQIKTPLTAAFLSLQLMENARHNSYVNNIKRQLERISNLEETLLTLSKIDAGVLQLEYEDVDVYTALNLAADNLGDLLLNRKIDVSIPDKGCVTFRGDLEWTMEALLNLMKNCMEHSESGMVVHCDYSYNPLYVEILVWDDAAGFAKEDIPHIFERFYKGSASGTGIGLSLAKSIFELQNGTISARNLPEGGACFEIRIYSH